MKKFTGFFVALILAASCDVIDDPFAGNPNPGTTPGEETVLRNVLIEEFTGHRCNNCPNAAAEIKAIQALPNIGERVIAIAIHAGPSNFTGTNPVYTTDFTTTEGDAWASFFGVVGLPTGMVSRNNWSPTGNQHLVGLSAWAGITNDLIAFEADFKIEIEAAFGANNNSVDASIAVMPLREIDGNHQLVVVITEDNIVAAQTMPDYTRNDNYVHQHVFRKTFNGAFGELAFTSSDPVGSEKVFELSTSLLPEWKREDLNVVAYIYNETTQEIKQVEKLRL
ncbi:MAG: Omp28 family outer membrane lipoprotein [Schleiferiaceae bacterium]|nr:Omp28 family outer membrane lipoprotein [Schleiferiaceae bacterium]